MRNRNVQESVLSTSFTSYVKTSERLLTQVILIRYVTSRPSVTSNFGTENETDLKVLETHLKTPFTRLRDWGVVYVLEMALETNLLLR